MKLKHIKYVTQAQYDALTAAQKLDTEFRIIDKEFATTTALQTATSALATNISAEATARRNADTTITTSLQTEVTRATGVENTLQISINSLSSSLDGKAAQADLTTEASTRATNDTALSNSISAANTNISNLTTSLSDLSSTVTNNYSSLNARLNNVESLGRYLSVWDASTGMATSNPPVPTGATTYTYTYRSGDWYRVGTVGNKIPTSQGPDTSDGGQTWGYHSTTISPALAASDMLIFNGTTWDVIRTGGGGITSGVTDVTVNGSSVVSGSTAAITVPTSLSQLSNDPGYLTSLNGAVLYSSQSLTTEQKTQARTNIGAGTITGVKTATGGDPRSTTIVDGNSIVPLATLNYPGLVYTNCSYGIGLNTVTGLIYLQVASDSDISSRNYTRNVICPENLDKAIREGLGNNSLTWSDAYKTAARNTIGAGQAIEVEF